MGKRKKKVGFTLIELVATMAIVGILMTVAFSLFSSSSRMLNIAEVDNELQDESRMVVSLIEDDLKFGSKIKLNNDGNFDSSTIGKEIEFRRKDGTKMKMYRYKFNETTKEIKKYNVKKVDSEGVEDSNGDLPEKEEDEKEIEMGTLSKNVEEFEVKYLDTKVFEIKIKLSKNNSEYEYKSSIFPMNK